MEFILFETRRVASPPQKTTTAKKPKANLEQSFSGTL
jgi:hypothetical protein